MTAGLASGAYDRTYLPVAKMGFEKREREVSSVVRTSEGTNLPLTTRQMSPENRHPRSHPLSLKVTSLISYHHLTIFKIRTARTELLRSRSPFTRITSLPPSPTLQGSPCHLCSRFPVSRGPPTTLSSHLSCRRGRDRGAQLMSSQPRRSQRPMNSGRAERLMLKATMLVRLRQNLLPSHRIHPQPNNSRVHVWP